MALDFRQVQVQVHQLADKAPARQAKVRSLREQARQLLDQYAGAFDLLRSKVQRVVSEYDPSLRCAAPPDPAKITPEPLTARFPLPPLPPQATLIAADGSQIPLDRHAEVEYSLVNVGAIQANLGTAAPPQTTVVSQLLYDDALYTETGEITEGMLALMRDLQERSLLASLAVQAPGPVVTFTDGPMELWGAKEPGAEGAGFQKHLDEYLLALRNLHAAHAIAAGYVDKPSADLVLRLLEVMATPEDELSGIKKKFPLRGVSDLDLYGALLQPGERSAVFAIQSQSARHYRDILGLHFFYLNVGRPGHAYVARVEIPAWVAAEPAQLDLLHAVLVEQCRVMGSRSFPYLLHRAHEVAVVTFEERDQVTLMIAQELRRRGIYVGEKSQKQAAKDLAGRTGYKR